MADISQDELREEIAAILKDADLKTMSAKKVRQQIEEKLEIDLTERKKEVDDLVMEHLQEKQEDKKKTKKAASDESEEGEEEEEEASEEEEEEEEKKPAKRGPPKKVAAPAKRKKNSSDDEESASDDDASDEEYSPKKAAKATPKKGVGKPGKKSKKKGSDSDSDEDWGKAKKTTTTAKKAGGKGKGGGGYTRPITLSPELAAVVGAKQMARHEVVKKVWSIIKERDLYDPKNKQFAICDDELMKVIGVKRFRTFGMMKYLKDHFVD